MDLSLGTPNAFVSAKKATKPVATDVLLNAMSVQSATMKAGVSRCVRTMNGSKAMRVCRSAVKGKNSMGIGVFQLVGTVSSS